jgi:hypothetical protein
MMNKKIFWAFLNSSSLEQLSSWCQQLKTAVKTRLHYSDYCSKLVHFEAKKIFSIFKRAQA